MITKPVSRKVTPALMYSLYQMTLDCKTKREMAQALEVSVPLLKRLRAGTYEHMTPDCQRVWQETFGAAHAQQGPAIPDILASNASVEATVPAAVFLRPMRSYGADANRKLAPTSSYPAEAVPLVPVDETEKEETMLLQNHVLEFETLDHFKLERSPFVDDINTRADVFVSPGTRRVRAAMLNAATGHGFIAVVGESGSGKTTLRKELEERIRIEKLPIRIIKPYVVGVEPSDIKGKTMKTSAISDAIARTLAPGVALKSSTDARMAQVQAMLASSMAAGYNNLLVIEEAHRLPQATLRHLKGFLELEDGMRRMLGVCLIGQPELDDLLGAQNRDIREIVQRCNRVALGALEDDLEAYLQHKFDRAGVKASTVLAANACTAIAARLVHTPRGGSRMNDTRSVCYPLMVNNLVCKAMNLAAREGWPLVDAQVIAGC